MNFQTLQLAYSASIATITLNRPDKRNAISYELIQDLLGAFEEVRNSSALVMILTGAGKAFCSGMDLENLKALIGRTPEQSREDSKVMAQLFRTLYDFPKPTIAAVNGAAVAGGTGLATLCDFTLAAPEAKFGYTEVRIGFVPAIVSTFLLAPGRRKNRARSTSHRTALRRRRSTPHRASERNRSRRPTAAAGQQIGRTTDGKQSSIFAVHQASAERRRSRRTRRAD